MAWRKIAAHDLAERWVRLAGHCLQPALAAQDACGDFGSEIGEKRASAQITKHYTPEALIGRQVLAVVNFPPRQIGKVLSEVLVLGLPDEDGEVVLIAPDQAVPLGGKLF